MTDATMANELFNPIEPASSRPGNQKWTTANSNLTGPRYQKNVGIS